MWLRDTVTSAFLLASPDAFDDDDEPAAAEFEGEDLLCEPEAALCEPDWRECASELEFEAVFLPLPDDDEPLPDDDEPLPDDDESLPDDEPLRDDEFLPVPDDEFLPVECEPFPVDEPVPVECEPLPEAVWSRLIREELCSRLRSMPFILERKRWLPMLLISSTEGTLFFMCEFENSEVALAAASLLLLALPCFLLFWFD